MNTPPTNREEEIFQTARALPAAERPAYLDAVCGEDHELRERVGRLLALHEASGFMEELPKTLRSEIEEQFARLKPEEAGERIGNYKLLEQIGEGGFGTVWMAEQEQPVRRRVALKIIKLGMDTKDVIARFEQERQALAMMDHSNIARVFDAGATQWGRPFFVMELVRGTRITDYCDEAKLPTRERLELFMQVCRAVQHAHQKGVIHRDLKPSNILVTLHDGVPVPKVIDFGIAKAIQHKQFTDLTFFTRFEQMLGTPLYMSPEQAEMSGLDVDTRSDIYSLGVLLYELLTGRTPSDPLELMQAGLDEIRRVIREQEPKKPSTALQTMAENLRTSVAASRHTDARTLTSLVRGDLDWIVMKAMEKDRSRRYATADAFAADIARHVQSEPIIAHPPSTAYLLGKLIRRNKSVFAAAASVTLALVLGMVGIAWQAHRADESANGQQKAKEQAQLETAKAKAQLRQASRSDLATAQQHFADSKWSSGVAYLGRAIRYDPENLNAKDALWLALLYGNRDGFSQLLHAFEHQGLVTSASFSADGSSVVTTSVDKTARIWDAKSGQPFGSALLHDGPVRSASFSPDGSRVVTASGSTARIWDAKSGQLIGSPFTHPGWAEGSPSFSFDGSSLLSVSKQTVRIWDAQSGQSIGSPLTHDDAVMSANFSPDGSQIVTASNNTALIWDLKSGQLVSTPLMHDGRVNHAHFSTDGACVLTTSHAERPPGQPAMHAFGAVRIWDAATGQSIGTPFVYDNYLMSARFNADDTRVVAVSEHNTVRIWDAKSGQPFGSALVHDSPVRSASFSPDGSRVVTAGDDKTARIWDAKSGQPLGSKLLHDGPVRSASFSPDGSRVVTASGSTARIWDAKSGGLIGIPLILDAGPFPIPSAFSPDGSRVVTTSSNTASIWDAKSGELIAASFTHKSPITSASFSPDGLQMVTASIDKTARIWDAKSGNPVATPLMHDSNVMSASFSPDGSQVVTASMDKTARIWDAKSGKPLIKKLLHDGYVESASFIADGGYVVTASHAHTSPGTPLSLHEFETVRIWDVKSGEPIGSTLRHDGPITSVNVSLDGSRVITSSNDKTVRIWDAKSTHHISSPLVHDGPVRSASFSPDGLRVVTASGNNAHIWDAKSGQIVGSKLKHDSQVTSASFNADGSRVVTAYSNKAHIWDANSGQPIGTALLHDGAVTSASFSSDGSRVVTASDDKTARIWVIKNFDQVPPGNSETLTAFCSGAILDSRTGTLQQVSTTERMELWRQLEAGLTALPGWRFAVAQDDSQDPRIRPIAPGTTMTIRQAATRLLESSVTGNVRRVLELDPGHPLLPFASAIFEAVKAQQPPSNNTHAAWLVDYGMKHLPADTNASDLRLAAKFVAKVAASIPEQRATALLLLDRARDKEPETDETKALREKLNK